MRPSAPARTGRLRRTSIEARGLGCRRRTLQRWRMSRPVPAGRPEAAPRDAANTPNLRQHKECQGFMSIKARNPAAKCTGLEAGCNAWAWSANPHQGCCGQPSGPSWHQGLTGVRIATRRMPRFARRPYALGPWGSLQTRNGFGQCGARRGRMGVATMTGQ